jgi:hypothetical protein
MLFGVRIWLALIATGVAAVGACATGTITPSTDGGGTDGTVADASGCPQYDLMTDPKHCGSCTNACASGQLCSAGTCKATCDTSLQKCASDGGYICADLKTDTNHCGQCTTACTAADGGGLDAGSNNPYPNFPYDSGTGWGVGSPLCDAGNCATNCGAGQTACSDGVCYDLQNFHDHCGNCNTACASGTEWCALGHCCPVGQMYCNGGCIDVLSNDSNCAGCGNACGSTTPHCYQGVCSTTCSPTGTRQPFNTLLSHTTTGCWSGNPCAQGTYVWQTSNGLSYQNTTENFICSGTTACVSHVGITTYASASNCQGTYDVYCGTTKVGSLSTAGKGCSGDAMTNGCSISFSPVSCSQIKIVATAGSVGGCCGTGSIDTMVTGVSAW